MQNSEDELQDLKTVVEELSNSQIWSCIYTFQDSSGVTFELISFECVVFSPNSNILASILNRNIIKVWNLTNGEETATINPLTEEVLSITFINNENIAIVCSDRTLKVWNVNSCRKIKDCPLQVDSINCATFSPDLNTVIIGDHFGYIYLCDLKNGEKLRSLYFRGDFEVVAYSPDHKIIASADNSGTIKLWNLNTSEEIHKFALNNNGFTSSIAFSPSSNTFATNVYLSKINLWDISNGKQISTFEEKCTSLAFSPNGKTLAGAIYGKPHTIKLWNLNTKKEVCQLEGELDYVSYLAFSPDGKTIASVSYNLPNEYSEHIIKVWQLPS